MTLQELMIRKMDEFCGRKELISKINFYTKLAPEEDKTYLANMSMCFDSFYETTIDVESQAIEFRDISLETIVVIEKYIKSHNCDTMRFLKDLILFKLNYMKDVRKLA